MYHFNEELSQVLCTSCRFAVALDQWDRHLRTQHQGLTTQDRKAILDGLAPFRERIGDPKEASQQPDGRQILPNFNLTTAFFCELCEERTGSVKGIQRHINLNHGGTGTRGRPLDALRATRWVERPAQAIFSRGSPYYRLFMVVLGAQPVPLVPSSPISTELEGNPGQSSPGLVGNPRPASPDQALVTTPGPALPLGLFAVPGALEDLFTETSHAQLARTTLTETEVVAMDAQTPWLRHVHWPRWFTGLDLSSVAALCVPARPGAEAILSQATALAWERSVQTLEALDRTTCQWLRSSSPETPSIRPMERLTSASGVRKYSSFWQTLTVFCIRVLGSATLPLTITLSAQQELTLREVNRLTLEVITGPSPVGNRGELQWPLEQNSPVVKALIPFFASLIRQRVTGDGRQSTLLMFGAAMGINRQGRRFVPLILANVADSLRFKTPVEYTGFLAGLLYGCRLFLLQAITMELPINEEETMEAWETRRIDAILTARRDWLINGTYSPANTIVTQLSFGLAIVKQTPGKIRVRWLDEEKTTLDFEGTVFTTNGIKTMVKSLYQEAFQDLKWLTFSNDRPEALPRDEDGFPDDLFSGGSSARTSFMRMDQERTTASVRLLISRLRRDQVRLGEFFSEEFLNLPGRPGRLQQSYLNPITVREWFRRCKELERTLLVLIHLTGGQPARGTEVTSIRLRDGPLVDRNLFFLNGRVTIITRYHKGLAISGRLKNIPRFLPHPVGTILKAYIPYVRPLKDLLLGVCYNQEPSDYLWAKGPGECWDTEDLTRALRSFSGRLMGANLTCSAWRHVAVAFSRDVVHIGTLAPFAFPEVGDHGEEISNIDDALEEDGLSDLAALQTAHGPRLRAEHYAQTGDRATSTSRLVSAFWPVSEAWHRWMGFPEAALASAQDPTHLADPQTPPGQPQEVILVPNSSSPSGSCSPCPSPGLTGVPQSPPPSTAFNQFAPGPSAPRPSVPGPFAPGTRRPLTSGSGAPVPKRARARTHLNSSSPPTSQYRLTALDGMRRVFGFRAAASPEQLEAAAAVLAKEPILVVVLPTGGGKSLIWMLQAAAPNPGTTVVILPFLALEQDLHRRCRLARITVSSWEVGSHPQTAVVTVVPERAFPIARSDDRTLQRPFLQYLGDLEQQGNLRQLVIDECHTLVTDASFRPAMMQLFRIRVREAPLLFTTGTLPPHIVGDFEEVMLLNQGLRPRYIRAPSIRKNIKWEVHVIPRAGGWTRAVQDIIKEANRTMEPGQKLIAFSMTRGPLGYLSGPTALNCPTFDGTMRPEEREAALLRWSDPDQPNLLATSAFGSGVDYPNVVRTVHFPFAYTLIELVQAAGRGGRDGSRTVATVVADLSFDRNQGTDSGWKREDHAALLAFIQARGCRQAFLGRYLDGGTGQTCYQLGGELCDNCTSVVTLPERPASQRGLMAANPRPMVGGSGGALVMARVREETVGLEAIKR